MRTLKAHACNCMYLHATMIKIKMQGLEFNFNLEDTNCVISGQTDAKFFLLKEDYITHLALVGSESINKDKKRTAKST